MSRNDQHANRKNCGNQSTKKARRDYPGSGLPDHAKYGWNVPEGVKPIVPILFRHPNCVCSHHFLHGGGRHMGSRMGYYLRGGPEHVDCHLFAELSSFKMCSFPGLAWQGSKIFRRDWDFFTRRCNPSKAELSEYSGIAEFSNDEKRLNQTRGAQVHAQFSVTSYFVIAW